MSALLPFVLAGMAALSPDRDHSTLGAAIAEVVEAERPLFADDDDRRQTASFYVAVLFRESSLDNNAIGDKGASHCAGQIYLPNGARTREGWTGAELRGDVTKCLAVVSRMLRASFVACRALPPAERMSLYARGSCTSETGRRLSRDRFALARRVHTAAAAALAKEDET